MMTQKKRRKGVDVRLTVIEGALEVAAVTVTGAGDGPHDQGRTHVEGDRQLTKSVFEHSCFVSLWPVRVGARCE